LPETPLRQMDEVLVMAMCFLVSYEVTLTYLCLYKQNNWRRVDVNRLSFSRIRADKWAWRRFPQKLPRHARPVVSAPR
jgi:hypothetical protein